MTAEQTEHEALTVGQARILLNRAWTCTCWPHTAMTARVPEVEAFLAGFHRSPTPRTVTTVETLEDVLPGIELTREFDVTEEDATIIGEYLVGLGYVLTPAIDPDNEALVEKVATLHAAGFVQPHLPTTDATVADAVRYFAESWRFKGKGLPDDMPDEHDEALDWCSMTLLAMLDRLSDDAPLGAECRNTGWLITAATCPRCKGSGRADSLTGASECAPCGGCGHVCDDLATVLAPALDPDDEALVATAAAAFQEAWDSGIQDFDPDHDDYDTYIQRCMRAALKAATS